MIMAVMKWSGKEPAPGRGIAVALLGLTMSLGAVLGIGLFLSAPAGGTASVELMVYSGRANPSFELTPAETDDLVHRLDRLPAGATPPDAPGLGYAGLLVTLPGPGLDRFTVYRGVRVEGADSRVDTEGVEGWLLDIARQRGHADLLDALGL